MPFCPSCNSEFRAGFTTCNTCHIPLVDSLDDDEPEEVSTNGARSAVYEDDAEDTLQMIATFEDDAQAIYVRRLLDDAGIPSVIAGGHGATIRSCEPYRIFVDEDYLEAAKETIESFSSPTLVTGQIEGNISRLSKELDRIERERDYLKPQVHAVRTSLTKLQSDLNTLNHELSEE
ncbi:MAG TPA: DUF2007 domain-containing protein [Blastocatellia bacterium]|nr:DUF2007 domain-containing protein [Blastocatellia bacterium]